MSLPTEIGQPNFIEVISVELLETESCNNDGQCFPVTGFAFERDLLIPFLHEKVKNAAAKKNIRPLSDYRIFFRDFRTQELTEVTPDTTINAKDSIVFVNRQVLTPRGEFVQGCGTDSSALDRIKRQLASRREILPSRFLFP